MVGVAKTSAGAEHGEAERERVAAGQVCELVHGALHDECVGGMQRRPPGTRRNDGRDRRILETDVRQALCREVVGVELRLDRVAPPGECITRCVREMLGPRDRRAGHVQRRAHAMDARRAIVVVLQVVVARANDLHGCADGLRQKRRLGRIVHHEPTAESAATAFHVHRDVRRGNADDARDEILRVTRDPASVPTARRGRRGRPPCSSPAPSARAR